jgi:hypothetical protein
MAALFILLVSPVSLVILVWVKDMRLRRHPLHTNRLRISSMPVNPRISCQTAGPNKRTRPSNIAGLSSIGRDLALAMRVADVMVRSCEVLSYKCNILCVPGISL